MIITYFSFLSNSLYKGLGFFGFVRDWTWVCSPCKSSSERGFAFTWFFSGLIKFLTWLIKVVDVGQRGLNHYKLSVLISLHHYNFILVFIPIVFHKPKFYPSFSFIYNPKNSYSPPLAYFKGPNKWYQSKYLSKRT